jgi:hypothetical protein
MVYAFLVWETTIAAIPGSLVEQYALLKSVPRGWWPIVAYTALSIVLFAVALGPDRLQAWWTWGRNSLSTGHADITITNAPQSSPQTTQSTGANQLAQQAQGETYEEYLRRLCRELAQELYRFLNEHGYSRSEDHDDPRIVQRDAEALRSPQFRENLRPRARNLLRKLKERGLYPPENLARFQQRSIENTLSLWAVERLADALSEIGHDW